MKKFYILLVALLMASAARAQSCLPQGIEFTTQNQIDSFQINYPGCTEIEGNVYINGYYDINNLDGLSILTSIGGTLTIEGCYTLTSLTGLESLTTIGNDVIISGNYALTSLTGLEGLSFIGGSFSINSNTSLICLDGLESLQTIAGSLKIGPDYNNWEEYGNPSLSSITGLNNLNSVGSNLLINVNTSLVSLTGLENLNSIGGDLMIANNFGLTSIADLGNIDEGSIINLSVTGNSSLSNCEVQWLCGYLSNPAGVINIVANANGCNSVVELTDICGGPIPCLPHGNYYLSSQADINNFQYAFLGCAELEGNVILQGNLTNLNGLNMLTSIGGDLVIRGTELTNLAGLEGIISIGEELWIYGNIYLTSLTGLDNLTYIGQGLSIGIYTHPGGSGNPSLTSLTGLDSVVTIGGFLAIIYNDSLTSLTGLDNLDAGSITDLDIYNNDNLSNCAVQSICDYLASPNGYVNINFNATGCNSEEEVDSACVYLSNGEINLEPEFSLYPNPASSTIIISTPSTSQKNTFMTIFNINGQMILSRKITEQQTVVDVAGLNAGIYVVKVVSDESVILGKIVKE